MIKELKNGNTLIYGRPGGLKMILISNGPSMKAIFISPNEYEPGSDEWANKEIEDYEIVKKYSGPHAAD